MPTAVFGRLRYGQRNGLFSAWHGLPSITVIFLMLLDGTRSEFVVVQLKEMPYNGDCKFNARHLCDTLKNGNRLITYLYI